MDFDDLEAIEGKVLQEVPGKRALIAKQKLLNNLTLVFGDDHSADFFRSRHRNCFSGKDNQIQGHMASRLTPFASLAAVCQQKYP